MSAKISELIQSLQRHLQESGDREVRVHCHGCCPFAHDIESMSIGGMRGNADEAECLVIEV